MKPSLPELLSPAGSPAALEAAIEGGADAVYLGGTLFNARIHAHNFDQASLRDAIARAHAYGVRVYLTLNTLVGDRELPELVRAAADAYEAGADALILADLGGAAAIHTSIPEMELHASTQMSGSNHLMGAELKSLGFSRMVIARETSAEDLRSTVKNNPLEVEVFVHGAHCVSHSGQCLFSSIVGGRSGNRGECAQPCRLPFRTGKKESYPLSLKDLSLAPHLSELIEMGVASLKIEGRMKPPEYVRDVTRIWRRLLDERRDATPDEMRELADVFSRQGFTDGYYTRRIGHAMLGVRTEENKSASGNRAPFAGLSRRIPLDLSATVCAGAPITLTLSDGSRSVTVAGDTPMPAENAPLSREVVERNLTKLGATHYVARSFSLSLDEGLMLPLSRLNELRRRAVDAWESEKAPDARSLPLPYRPSAPTGNRGSLRSAHFTHRSQIPSVAWEYFDRIYLPLMTEEPSENVGVILPPVLFDRELTAVRQRLSLARARGVTHALVQNLSQLPLVREAGLTPVGDFRLNVTNTATVARLEELGITDEILLSPELTLPQLRDVGGNVAAIVYGRIPLMITEKCIGREIADCTRCQAGAATLTDRRGVEFPVLREWEHRSLILNSIPTAMSDKTELLEKNRITARHFLFTTESSAEVERVIDAYRRGKALGGPVRRI